MKVKKTLCTVIAALFTIFTMLSYIPATKVKAAIVVPKIQFATAPVTQYKVGERVNFNINAPNYGGRVEYRVVLWEDSKKTYHDLWSASNGHPTRYYTKWQPYGNEIFTLGWIINEPGSYRITVYAKRLGVANNKTYLKGYNCDSYMESVAFKVGANSTVGYIMASTDVIVNQGQVPSLPSTVKAIMTDGTEKSMGVTWGSVNTSQAGAYTIQGTVQGTDKKAVVRVIVNATTPASGLSINSISAVSTTLVNVNLKSVISTIPSSSTFSIKNSSNTAVRIVTTSLSTDKKTIQIYTDFMTPGGTYTLVINGVSYNFIVPYTGSSTGSISISVDDMVVAIDDEVDPDITVYPSNATLRFSSEDDDIAEVNSSTGEVTGIEEGTVTIYVYAYSATYGTAYTTFEVEVVEDYDNLPDKDYCDADYEYDDDDELYTITLFVMDEDDDAVENLDEDDFSFYFNDKAYDFDDDDILYDFDEVDDGEYEFIFDPYGLSSSQREDVYDLDVLVNGRKIISGYELSEDGGSSTGTPSKKYSDVDTHNNKDGSASIYVTAMDSSDDPIKNLDEGDFKVKIQDTNKTYTVGLSTSPFDEFNVSDYKYGEYEFKYEPTTLPTKGYITVNVIVKGVVIKEGMRVYVSDENAVVKVTNITVKSAEDATTVKKDDTLQMEANILPTTATNQKVKWAVEAETGAAWIDPDTGTLHATKGGTVIVKATATDGSAKYGTKIITVTVLVESVTINTAEDVGEVENGKTLQCTADILPLDATIKGVTWSIESGEATIDANGLLTATGLGDVTVMAVSKDGTAKFGEKVIKVIAPKTLVTGITIKSVGEATTLIVDHTLQMSVDVLPADASNKEVTWDVIKGTGEGFITKNGILTAETVGTITVTATAKDGSGVVGSKDITITPAP